VKEINVSEGTGNQPTSGAMRVMILFSGGIVYIVE
jgi:hypothetical protein